MKEYSQLTEDERYHINAYKAVGFSPSEIAKQLGRHKSSIYREISRNSGERGYRPKQAQKKAEQRRTKAYKAVKMTPEVITFIELKIREDWSPEQISGWLKLEKLETISHERIYQHIWADKRNGGDLYLHLRRQGKQYQKRRNGKTSRGQIKNRVSIDKRPAVVDQKTRVGDWEIDTVIGKGHKGALVTLVERKTSFTLAARVETKQADVVAAATIELLKPYKGRTHTITADNGKEFALHEEIAKAIATDFYFAHPYHSWERGANENTNGLLRQYFPKDTNFLDVSDHEVCAAVSRLNTRPRKKLGYKTPETAMQRSLNRLVA
jgi:IS30 family transposase